MYKYILPPIIFCKVPWVWKLPIWLSSSLIYALFEDFIQNVENITRIIYAWETFPHNKILPNLIETS